MPAGYPGTRRLPREETVYPTLRRKHAIEALSHHLDEEERDVLNPARTDVSEQERRGFGDAFAEERARLSRSGCGDIANVRKIVEPVKD